MLQILLSTKENFGCSSYERFKHLRVFCTCSSFFPSAVCHDFCMTTGTRHVRKSQTSRLAQSNDWCTGANCTSPSWLIHHHLNSSVDRSPESSREFRRPRGKRAAAALLHDCTVLEHVAAPDALNFTKAMVPSRGVAK